MESGITINNHSESEIVGNTIRRCKKSAVLISVESSANILENEIIKNTKDQIVVSKSCNPLIQNNVIKGGKFTGISVFEGCKPIIDGNEIAENEKAVSQIKEGKASAIGFLVGQAMKKTKGKANPKKVGEIIRKKLTIT